MQKELTMIKELLDMKLHYPLQSLLLAKVVVRLDALLARQKPPVKKRAKKKSVRS